MRILIVGAGGVGGYFGARLLAAGRDVTFLVRPGRAAQLKTAGLRVRSGYGDVDIDAPPVALAGSPGSNFDLVILSCKAYDLADAIESFAPAVGPRTTVLPLLNGMRHLDVLAEHFGPDAVLGGYCLISSALDAEGRVVHVSDLHSLILGERDGEFSPRVQRIADQLGGAGFDFRVSDSILGEMWEKWVFIAALAGATCLMRAPIGTVLEAGGEAYVRALLEECASIAAANGHPPGDDAYRRALGMLTARNSAIKASMLRDIERGQRTEGEHILGDLLRRRIGARTDTSDWSALTLAHTHVRAYEASRQEIG